MNAFLADMSGAMHTLIDKGGPTMIALGVLSIAVVAVFIARTLSLAFARDMSPALAAAARAAAGQTAEAGQYLYRCTIFRWRRAGATGWC